MKEVVKVRLLKYLKSFFVIGLLMLLLSHGPHGGAAVGLLAALFLGFILASTIWLLDFKWYWNMFCGFLISTFTVLFSTLIAKKLPFENQEIIFTSIISLIVLTVFIILIELTNILGRYILTNKL